MEDEKNITKPKRKKAVSVEKKKSSVEENTENSLKLENFQIDLVGEVKPERKTKPVSTRKKKTVEVKSETDEAEKIIDAFVAKPRKRRTTVKKADAADSAISAEEAPLKTTRKRTVKKAVISKNKTPIAETSTETNLFSQSETSAAPDNVLSQKVKTIQTENPLSASDEKDYFADKSPVFKELALPKLPNLQPENRAWLQMQSPTRIFFYWSLKNNPFETLQKVFGGRSGNYALSVKLQNLANGTEKIYPLAPYGSAWFDVESNSKYRAEVGFFAAGRPFIRLLFSNVLETPRLSPSPRFDWSPRFAVTTQRFAEVLDVSGYKQDAFEMALAGDNVEASNKATFTAFEQLTGESEFEVKASELRFVLFALASGVSLGDLRDQISPQLFAYLEKLFGENAARLSKEKILAALKENFEFGDLEAEEETSEVSYSVVGASLINFRKFPKSFWKKFTPSSSLRISS